MESKHYGISVETAKPYEEAVAGVKEALKAEGFGVLTEIDVRETMKQKLGVDFRHYDIIGACNPPLAHKALSADVDIGLLLPCNVVVYEGESGKCTIAAIDPDTMVSMTGNEQLRPVASEAKARLTRALAAAA